jgi:hypothetical protein
VCEWLEENGGQVTGVDPDTGKDRVTSAWPDVCGSAVQDPDAGFRLGCDGGAEDGGCLLSCSFCCSSWHPACAGLSPTTKRHSDDWACPECAHIAEDSLLMVPLHLDPGADAEATAAMPNPFESADSEDPDDEKEPPRGHVSKVATMGYGPRDRFQSPGEFTH